MGGPRKRAREARAATRVERDLIGAMEIPRGARYGIQTARAVTNLSFSGRTLGDYPAMVRALAMVKCAAARANLDAGVIEARIARAIEHACRALIAGGYLEQFVADPLGGGGGIGVNQNVNEVIANLASEHLGGSRGAIALVDAKTHVNASQSTADACATAARIAITGEARGLAGALEDCVRAYRAKARELRRVITLARTCLRDAQPTSLGEFFSGHAAAIERRADELARSVRELRRVNLGGTGDRLWKRRRARLSARHRAPPARGHRT